MIKKLRQLVLKKVNFRLRKNLNGRCFRIPMLAGLGGAMRRHHEPWMLENLIQIAGEAGGSERRVPMACEIRQSGKKVEMIYNMNWRMGGGGGGGARV